MNTEIFMTHVNAHQRVTSAEKGFHSKVDGTTYSADTTQPLPLAILATAQWAHE